MSTKEPGQHLATHLKQDTTYREVLGQRKEFNPQKKLKRKVIITCYLNWGQIGSKAY